MTAVKAPIGKIAGSMTALAIEYTAFSPFQGAIVVQFSACGKNKLVLKTINNYMYLYQYKTSRYIAFRREYI
jgi:hypothetical protein